MNNTIRVLIKEPGKVPEFIRMPNTLESFQKLVGGYIETVTLASDLVIICNEEGKLQGLPYNCDILGMSFVGTLIFAGIKGDEFSDVPISEKDFKRLLPKIWED